MVILHRDLDIPAFLGTGIPYKTNVGIQFISEGKNIPNNGWIYKPGWKIIELPERVRLSKPHKKLRLAHLIMILIHGFVLSSLETVRRP